jgi:hypothetical protein
MWVAAVIMSVCAMSANAQGLLGGEVTVTNYSPNLTTVYGSPISGPTGTAASPGTVYAEGYGFSFTSDTITLTDPYSGSYSSVPAGGFNGFVLAFSGIPTITSVANSASTPAAYQPTSLYVSGNSIYIDFNGTARTPTETFVVTTAVPEPSLAWLILAGIPALFIRRRRNIQGCEPATQLS